MPLDGPQLAEQGEVFNKNFFEDFRVRSSEKNRGYPVHGKKVCLQVEIVPSITSPYIL